MAREEAWSSIIAIRELSARSQLWGIFELSSVSQRSALTISRKHFIVVSLHPELIRDPAQSLPNSSGKGDSRLPSVRSIAATKRVRESNFRHRLAARVESVNEQRFPETSTNRPEEKCSMSLRQNLKSFTNNELRRPWKDSKTLKVSMKRLPEKAVWSVASGF